MRKNLFLLLFSALCALPALAVGTTTLVFAEHDTCSLKMDVYQPDDTLSQHPCVCFVFGGGFMMGSRDTKPCQKFLTTMAENGVVGVAIDYRLGLKGFKSNHARETIERLAFSIDLAVEDVMDATAYLVEHCQALRIHPEQIVLVGSSAGAISSLQADYYLKNGHPLAQRLPAGFHYGGIVSCAGALARFDKKICYAQQPDPTYFLHGTKDELVPYSRTVICGKGMYGPKYLSRKFRKAGWAHRIMRYKNFGHEVSLLGFSENPSEILYFIREDVQGSQKPVIHDEKHIEPSVKKPLWNINKLDLYKKSPKLKVTEDPIQLARIKALEQ
ncbi:MAG: carboxylesterase family protein [Paludibacteraceae bacterium]|nr:carboxylesterase family protein [Paludibacteraceae bacterium]